MDDDEDDIVTPIDPIKEKKIAEFIKQGKYKEAMALQIDDRIDPIEEINFNRELLINKFELKSDIEAIQVDNKLKRDIYKYNFSNTGTQNILNKSITIQNNTKFEEKFDVENNYDDFTQMKNTHTMLVLDDIQNIEQKYNKS